MPISINLPYLDAAIPQIPTKYDIQIHTCHDVASIAHTQSDNKI